MPIVYHMPDGESVSEAEYEAGYAAYLERVAAAGRAAWSALHTQRNPTHEWFETEWKPLIPQGCGCAGSANELLNANPPRFDSPDDFFCWSVQYHNAVNRKLGKPEMTLEDALAIWRPPS